MGEPRPRLESTQLGPSREDELAFDRLLVELSDAGVVHDGPFAGMKICSESSWAGIAPYLVGSYEQELHEAIETLLENGYRTVVDIGCAEGYYAVGLATRLPNARIVAFDIDAQARSLCTATAEANGVQDRVDVRGACDPATLASTVTDETLVIVDCEGAEVDLLRPDLVPQLRDADLVVELHDFVDPTISGTIADRFAATHAIELIDAGGRDPKEFRALDDQPAWVQFLAMFEGRPVDPHPMQWAVMRSRSRRDRRFGTV